MTRIAVFGLGAMGGGMARSCLAAGLTTHGFDIDAARVAEFQSQGGAPGEMTEVAASLDVVATVVLNADQTEGVLFGEKGVVPHLSAGAVILSCATMAPPSSIRI